MTYEDMLILCKKEFNVVLSKVKSGIRASELAKHTSTRKIVCSAIIKHIVDRGNIQYDDFMISRTLDKASFFGITSNKANKLAKLLDKLCSALGSMRKQADVLEEKLLRDRVVSQSESDTFVRRTFTGFS